MNPKNVKKVSKTKKVKSSSTATSNAAIKSSKPIVTNDVKSKEPQKEVEPKSITFERSSSLRRTLSKIYTKLSGSKENLDKVKDNEKSEKPEVTTYKFQRSLTLNSIQVKKTHRNSFLDNRLEKLSEEKICENEKTKSPPTSPLEITRTRSPTAFRQSMPPGSFDNVDFSLLKPPNKLERSGSFISLIRRKISSSDSKPASLNSNWATSLQSLQQIDNMVSYEDLSFVDYDKFNQYEQQVNKMLNRQQSKEPKTRKTQEAINTSVVQRRPKKLSRDVNSNLDHEKNLYRQSIDSHKLSAINFNSHRWSNVSTKSPFEWLSLENPTLRSTLSGDKEAFIASSSSVSPSTTQQEDNSITSCSHTLKRKTQSYESLLIPHESFKATNTLKVSSLKYLLKKSLFHCHSYVLFNSITFRLCLKYICVY